MDSNTPCCRGLYLGYHVSCQAVLEDNSYTHLVSLTTYSLWIAQIRYFKKWKNSNCIISDLLSDISRCRHYAWDKERKILTDKLYKFP